jgi:hypothetical protein
MAMSILALWLPFLVTGRQDVLLRYWDGPSYVTAAYALYSPASPAYAAYGFPPEFYASHFPAYPLAIRLFSFLGYFDSMLFATALFSVLAVIAFYFLARHYLEAGDAFLLSVIFVFFPARWLIYHSVGASEPLFLFATLTSVAFFQKRNFPLASAFGILAALTRVFGVILFPAYIAALWFSDRRALKWKNVALLSLIPLAVLALFSFYAVQFGDFFAAFRVNAGYFKGPYSAVTDFGGAQAGEFTVLLLGAYALGTVRLLQRKRFDLFIFSALLVIPLFFLSHNDLSRYLLAAFPFALLFAFDDFIVPLARQRTFWLAFGLFVIGAYVYAWNVIPSNLMPAPAFHRLALIVGS